MSRNRSDLAQGLNEVFRVDDAKVRALATRHDARVCTWEADRRYLRACSEWSTGTGLKEMHVEYSHVICVYV